VFLLEFAGRIESLGSLKSLPAKSALVMKADDANGVALLNLRVGSGLERLGDVEVGSVPSWVFLRSPTRRVERGILRAFSNGTKPSDTS